MEPRIIDRGRGPEIAGTRITVYDVLDYHKHGWHPDRIASLFRLSSEDIQAALLYIDEHKEKVMENYRALLDRHRNYQYPPDVQEKLQRCRGVATARLAELRNRPAEEVQHARDHG